MDGQTMVLSVLVRMGQTAIECTPTLAVGLLVAAILRRMVGAAGTRRIFGGKGLGGLFRAWLIGSLLPVCSLGVIPVAREMVRAGVPWPTVLSFVLAAPQLNPLSFLYGLTLSEPMVIVFFVVTTMGISIVGGELWRRFFSTGEPIPVHGDETMPPPGLGRLGLVFVTACRETIGASFPYCLASVLLTGLLAGLIPHGALSTTMRHDSWLSTPVMALVGTALYSGVLQGMMRIGLIFEHGNSTGAAFALFAVGVGLNLGLVAWLVVSKGPRVLAWLALVLGMVVLAGWSMDKTLYFAEEEASHTHAFDDWTSPFPAGTGAGFGEVWNKWVQKAEVLEPLAIALLFVQALVGVVLLGLDRKSRIETWLCRPKVSNGRPESIFNRGVPGPVLGLVALAGLVVFSLVSLYIYYPPAEEAFNEISRVRADALTAVRTGKTQDAIRQLEAWDLLTRKLQVGEFLRTGRLDQGKRERTEALREELEGMRDDLLAGNLEGARSKILQVEKAHVLCRSGFQ
jgi:uncharacterized membrane protein YraQ (UPF0718 family)